MSPRVHVLHENPEWVEPLAAALVAAGTPYALWDIAEGAIDLGSAPPPGVFYCRMSASAHTRGHVHAAAYVGALLAWLEGYGRRVVNGSSALALELSKVHQHAALTAEGIRVPATRVAVGRSALLAAAKPGPWPLIVKPNRGGKGLGVRRFDTLPALVAYAESAELDAGPDGTLLVQAYIRPPVPRIVRHEFVGGRHLYSVEVDTSEGFELCPADACSVDDLACPVADGAQARFRILPEYTPPGLAAYERLLAVHRIEIAGIEMITGADGAVYTYDINVNTNYSGEAEARAGLAGTERSGMRAVARFLTRLLEGEEARATNAPVVSSG